MTGILPVYEKGPITFTVGGSNVVMGGQVVMVDTVNTGSVVAAKGTGASHGSLTVIGVALDDAIGPSASQNATDPLGNAITSIHQYPNVTTVLIVGVVRLVYQAACTFGTLVRTVDSAGTAGQVAAYTGGSTTYDEIIGRCIEPLGVSGAGQTGLTVFGFGASV